MTSLVDAKDVVAALEFCNFRPVGGWSRHVLVVWPHSLELVNTLLEYDCTVTIAVPTMHEYTRLQQLPDWESKLQTRKIRLVYGDPYSFVAAAPLQHFVAVFIADPDTLDAWQYLSRRVLSWNGSLCCFGQLSSAVDMWDGHRDYPARLGKLPGYRSGIVSVQDGAGVRVHCFEKQIGWMIMGYPRCGTHMLVSALNSHPELSCGGEAFNPATPAGSHVFSAVPQVLERSWPTQRSGFAVHSSIDRMGYPLNMASSMYGYTDFWKHIPDYTPTILLTRRNLLERYVSQLVAMKTGVWNSDDPAKRNNVYASVYVDINAFMQDMKYVQDCWDNAAAYFKYSLSVVYEDMLADFDGTMQRIQQYLHVPYVQVQPETVKLSVSMQETVENYVQVQAWCKRTGHSHFLMETMHGV